LGVKPAKPEIPMPRRTPILFASSILVVALAACSGATGASTTTPTTTAPATSQTSQATAGASAAPASAVTGKVSANTATEAEIAAGLTAAGVPNADRWAREVAEYRPYPTDDPTLQKLQDNLAKYQPDAATLDAILSALQP
jgi:hypothetical protein